MSTHSANGKTGIFSHAKRTKKPAGSEKRRLAFESLESRRLLSTVTAPTAIAFKPTSTEGTSALTSANNSSATKELSFLVSGVTVGNTVNVYADGNTTTAIATGTVLTGTSVTVTTTANSTLADGSHTFAATQTSSGTASSSSGSITVQVFTDLTATVTSALATSATVGTKYTYQCTTTTDAPTGDALTFAAGTSLPSGMTYNAANQTFTWTPTTASAGTTQSFTETVTDALGNSTTVGPMFVSVAAAGGLTVVTPAANIAVNSPVLVAVDDTNSGTPNFSVTTSDSHLTASFMPQTNQVLQIVTNFGTMDLQLFNNDATNTVKHFVSLVDSGTYTNTSFYRIIQSFMDQGGVNGSVGSSIPVELNADLRFTSSGLLAMANNGVDGNSSEFFITNPNDMSDGFLDFRYTIFGKLISGDNVRQAIAATPVTSNASSGEDSQPLVAPKIESMSIITETSDSVLMLKAATGATGSYTVTVSDGLGHSQSFQISVGTNSYDPPNPWVAPINGTDTITTAENTAVTFTPQGEAAAGGTAQVNVQLLLPIPGIANSYVDNSYIPTVTGYFELEEGSTATSEINFNSTELNTTAADIQTALQTLSGLSGTTVTAVAPSGSNPTSFSFTVTFAGSQSPLTYLTTSGTQTVSNLEASFANSATASATTQTLTFTYDGPVADTTNPDVTLTQNGSSYILTPTSGYQGIQYLEITAVTPVTGTFVLDVGTTPTASISFDSTNLATTAANIQSALDKLSGLSGTTVTAVSPLPTLDPTDFNFTVTFPGSQALVSLDSSSTLPVTLKNSAVGASTTQTLTFDESSPGTSWDSSSNVSPVYRAYVPIFIGKTTAPATPKIASITAGGQTVSGSTVYNNSSTASAFTFNITGAVAGDTVSLYMDGGSMAIASATVASGATTATLTTNGTTQFAAGSHKFTVKEATPESTLYADFAIGTDSSGYNYFSPASEYQVPASAIASAASAGTSLSIGFVVVAPPSAAAPVNQLYTYNVQTNAPASDAVTITPVTMPSGMSYDAATQTFTWTPTTAQTATFSATVSDSFGNTASIGPTSIVSVAGAIIDVPTNSTQGGNVTVSFSGNTVKVYNNLTKSVLSTNTFKSTDTISIVLPASQANSVSIAAPSSSNAALPKVVQVLGGSGGTNQVTVVGAGGSTSFTVAGNTVTANGLATQLTTVQNLALDGGSGSNYYTLSSSGVPVSIVAGGNNTLDFSHDTAGVTVNLGLDKGQAQTIAPWNTTLSISGVINKLIGSAYADVLTGGPAAVTEIVGGAGNDRITGGSGQNILLGGSGSDTIVGGQSRNLIVGGTGNSTIYAGSSQNMIFAGMTNNNLNDQALLSLLQAGPLLPYSYMLRRAMASSGGSLTALEKILSLTDTGAHDTVYGPKNSNNLFIMGKYSTLQP